MNISALLGHTLMISGFVFVMMLAVEYLNVLTRGRLDHNLARSRLKSLLSATLLGAAPGCLGSFAVVSLYIHRVLNFGALVAAMIATSGDEAFVMLTLFPRQALILFGILAAIGVVAGLLTDRLSGGLTAAVVEDYQAQHSDNERCVCFSWTEFTHQWKQCSWQRALLTVFLFFFTAGVISGQIGHRHTTLPGAEPVTCEHEHLHHDHAHHQPQEHSVSCYGEDGGWNWVRITMLMAGLFGLFVVVSVPNHFLSHHLWGHLVCKHLWHIFLWTLGALFVLDLITAHLHLSHLIEQNRWMVLLSACAIGIIPQSGPHLLFVTFYAQGLIPFSILLASSVVQDGHGTIPLLAHSRKTFLNVKLINLGIGLFLGAIGLLTGW